MEDKRRTCGLEPVEHRGRSGGVCKVRRDNEIRTQKKLTAEKPRVLRLETQISQQHLFDHFTTPDFVYIVGMILSAFAIFLSFGTICGEKQTHTLSLLMSHPIRRPTLLFAKWMGGYI